MVIIIYLSAAVILPARCCNAVLACSWDSSLLAALSSVVLSDAAVLLSYRPRRHGAVLVVVPPSRIAALVRALFAALVLLMPAFAGVVHSPTMQPYLYTA